MSILSEKLTLIYMEHKEISEMSIEEYISTFKKYNEQIENLLGIDSVSLESEQKHDINYELERYLNIINNK